jgi:predicted secreted Zn-dependent protease
MNATQIAITLVAGLILGGAAVGIFLAGGNDKPSSIANTAVEPSATASPAATATDVPASPAPEAEPITLPDRTTCDEISGTAYRSESEREFYIENCVNEAAPPSQQASSSPPPLLSADSSVDCVTSIDIDETQNEVTYDVSGINLDEIADSLMANAPRNGGTPAYGLTEYSYSLDGSFCGDPNGCSLGDIVIHADVVVTLPNLTTLDQVSGDVAQIWSKYASDVAIHEGRHVRILEEGLDEIKRLLLLIDGQPDCTILNHEIDKVWTIGGTQIETRQRAFHIADAQGTGGLVVQ